MNPVKRIKRRIARYVSELSQLEKEGNTNCDRAHELRDWIASDFLELKTHTKI